MSETIKLENNFIKYNLKLEGILYGKNSVEYDLEYFIYPGAASYPRSELQNQITNGGVGDPEIHRTAFVKKLHDDLAASLIAGGSQAWVINIFCCFRSFVQWIDATGLSFNESEVKNSFIKWADYLAMRTRLKQIKSRTGYHLAQTVASVLDRVLNVASGTFLRLTSITFEQSGKKSLGTQADKEVLTSTFAFGHMLLDFTDQLTKEAIFGSLPVTVRFRTGDIMYSWGHHWRSQYQRAGEPKIDLENTLPKGALSKTKQASASANKTLSVRSPFINLRIEAEMLIFIGQTGMNLAQVRTLKTGNFTYQSHLDGYLIRRIYKDRKHGEVEFEIFSAYRSHFERYLAWLREVLNKTDDMLLFPFIPQKGSGVDIHRGFHSIERKCEGLGISFVCPRQLRKTRLNWLLRTSQDPRMTAEMGQHSQQTLLRTYAEPHHQVAIVEISRFFAAGESGQMSAGPGGCAGLGPVAVKDAPAQASIPDCISPSGCLFCTQQRDIDSFDHVWSLCTYRHLKSLEFARYPAAFEDQLLPSEAAIQKIGEKLKAFEKSSAARAVWVEESLLRVAEGDFHPRWDGWIAIAELGG